MLEKNRIHSLLLLGNRLSAYSEAAVAANRSVERRGARRAQSASSLSGCYLCKHPLPQHQQRPESLLPATTRPSHLQRRGAGSCPYQSCAHHRTGAAPAPRPSPRGALGVLGRTQPTPFISGHQTPSSMATAPIAGEDLPILLRCRDMETPLHAPSVPHPAAKCSHTRQQRQPRLHALHLVGGTLNTHGCSTGWDAGVPSVLAGPCSSEEQEIGSSTLHSTKLDQYPGTATWDMPQRAKALAQGGLGTLHPGQRLPRASTALWDALSDTTSSLVKAKAIRALQC